MHSELVGERADEAFTHILRQAQDDTRFDMLSSNNEEYIWKNDVDEFRDIVYRIISGL